MRATNSTPNRISASNVFRWLMGITGIFFFVGVFLLPICYRQHHSTGWPTTDAIIRSGDLEEWMRKPHREPSFKPRLIYEYSVNSVAYVGQRVSFEDDGGVPVLHEAEARAWLKQNYPVGKRVTVYYDPADPNLAVLVPGAESLIWICYSWIVTTAVCFLLALIRYRIARREELKVGVQAEVL